MCDIDTIPNKYFYSFKDNDHFIYGFEINSIFKMLNEYEPINPYNRNKLSKKTINDITYLYKLINIHNSNINKYHISNKSIKQQVTDVFYYLSQQV